MKYEIVELEDISNVIKRISAKIIVDLDVKNKEDIESFVMEIIEDLREQQVEKATTLERHGNKPFEVVYVNVYKNKNEANHGLPLATVSYINTESKFKTRHLGKKYINDNTTISYSELFDEFNNTLSENMVSDEVFLQNVSRQFNELLKVYEKTKLKLQDIKELAIMYNDFEKYFIELSDDFVGFPNDEYVEMYHRHLSLQTLLSNIGLIANSSKHTETQKRHLINLYFKDSTHDIDYMRKKLN